MKPIQFTLTKKQNRFVFSDKRFVIGVGGKQTGKSLAAVLALFHKVDKIWKERRRPAELLIVAPTYPNLYAATLRRFHEVADIFSHNMQSPAIIPSDIKGGSSEVKHKMVLYNGSIAWYVSADKVRGFEGMTLDLAWIDDAQWVDRNIFIELINRTARRQGQIFVTAAFLPNLSLPDWLVELYNRFLAHDPDVEFVNFTVADLHGISDPLSGTQLLSPKELEIQQRLMTQDEYRVYVLGDLSILKESRKNKLFPEDAVHNATQRWQTTAASIHPSLRQILEPLWEKMRITPPPPAPNPTPPPDHIIIGLDPAGTGSDNSVASIRYQSTVLALDNLGSVEAPILQEHVQKLYEQLSTVAPTTLAIDAIGLGHTIASYLSNAGIPTIPVRYNAPAENKMFLNWKAEKYFEFLTLLQSPNAAIPPSRELIMQILATEMEEYKGRNKIADRKKSPDMLDSIIVSLAVNDWQPLQLFFGKEK